jgi:hypothetical protein
VANWTEPDDPKRNIQNFYKLVHAKQSEMRRLITAANVPAGSAYEDALIKITQDPQAAKDLNAEDLYVLVSQGLSEEWTTAAIYKAFVRTKTLAEAAGWARSTRLIREWAPGLGFAFEAMQEGMEYLRTLGVVKSASGDPLAWEFADKEMLERFRVSKFMEYPKWMRELVFSDTEPEGHLKRYLVEQGSVCRVAGKKKKGEKSRDVEEAGKRSVCQWLLWVFPPSPGWADLKGLYGNVPTAQGLQSKILQCISEGPVYGPKYDQERATTTAYKLDDERKLGLPLERDCGGLLPSAFKTSMRLFMKSHPYITRGERAEAMKVPIAEPDEGSGVGAGSLEIDETLVYNIVASENTFGTPSVEAIEAGLEYLWVMEEGEWSDFGAGVELVWLTLPLPKRVTGEEMATYEFLDEELWETEEVKEAIKTGMQLLTGAGVLVVVAPVGVPSEDIIAAAEVWPRLQPKIRSTVTVLVDGKKTKVREDNLQT